MAMNGLSSSGRICSKSTSYSRMPLITSSKLNFIFSSNHRSGRDNKFGTLFYKQQVASAVLPPSAVPLSTPLEGKESSLEDFSLGQKLRPDFPILDQILEGSGKPLIYLDSAATSQNPKHVSNVMQEYYDKYNSNVHRGVHTLSAHATDAYEAAREKVSAFINAPSSRQLIFTRNASEAINLVAFTWGLENIGQGDEIILSVAEHHSNLVPWQMLAKRKGARLRFAELTASESLNVEQVQQMVCNRTKLVALHHVSNTLGNVNPLGDIVARAHRYGAKVLIDACQSLPHMAVDVQALDVDFLAASAHKMCGPTGIGFLYGRKELLQAMPPFMGGGEMISEVFLDHSTYAEPPSKFEAGTPAIAEAIGLGAAVDYLSEIGMDRVHQYETLLGTYLYTELSKVKGVRVYGPRPTASSPRAALCTFNVRGLHPTDLSTFLDQQHGVAIRSGHHCTQPLHRHLGISASARASLYLYNTKGDVDAFITALKDTIEFFSAFSDAEG